MWIALKMVEQYADQSAVVSRQCTSNVVRPTSLMSVGLRLSVSRGTSRTVVLNSLMAPRRRAEFGSTQEAVNWKVPSRPSQERVQVNCRGTGFVTAKEVNIGLFMVQWMLLVSSSPSLIPRPLISPYKGPGYEATSLQINFFAYGLHPIEKWGVESFPSTSWHNMKALESGWSNQRQENSISYKKFLPRKITTYMVSYLDTIPWNASYVYLSRYMSATVQNKFYVSFLRTYHKMSATINKCQVPYLKMLSIHIL